VPTIVAAIVLVFAGVLTVLLVFAGVLTVVLVFAGVMTSTRSTKGTKGGGDSIASLVDRQTLHLLWAID